jgi:hypothetical protein
MFLGLGNRRQMENKKFLTIFNFGNPVPFVHSPRNSLDAMAQMEVSRLELMQDDPLGVGRKV